MELKEILSRCDHTLLTQTATWPEIRAICDDGIRYQTASVCIPAVYVKAAKDYVGDKLAICTVIGFPPFGARAFPDAGSPCAGC